MREMRPLLCLVLLGGCLGDKVITDAQPSPTRSPIPTSTPSPTVAATSPDDVEWLLKTYAVFMVNSCMGILDLRLQAHRLKQPLLDQLGRETAQAMGSEAQANADWSYTRAQIFSAGGPDVGRRTASSMPAFYAAAAFIASHNGDPPYPDAFSGRALAIARGQATVDDLRVALRAFPGTALLEPNIMSQLEQLKAQAVANGLATAVVEATFVETYTPFFTVDACMALPRKTLEELAGR